MNVEQQSGTLNSGHTALLPAFPSSSVVLLFFSGIA